MDYETLKIKANIDEQGNGAFPSNTNIISHDEVPLRDFINQRIVKAPDGKTYNSFGTIFLEGLDLNNLKETIVNGYVMDGINLPINHNGYLNVQALSATYCVQTFSSVVEDCVFQRKLVNGVWQGWKLVAGEVLLWSGSAGVGAEISTSFDLNLFGTLKLRIDYDSRAILAPGFIGSDYVNCVHNYASGSSGFSTSIFLKKINNNQISVQNVLTCSFTNGGYPSILTDNKIKSIYGRP